MRTDIRQGSFSFINQLDIPMSETKEILSVDQIVRDFSVRYAKSRGIPVPTRRRYENGESDNDPLIQAFAEVYQLGIQNAPEKEDYKSRYDEAMLAIEDAMRVGNERLKDLTSAEATIANQVTKISKLAAKLTNLHTVLDKIKTRAAGSIFGKGKDIIATVDGVDRDLNL